jgi:hypothetical protein
MVFQPRNPAKSQPQRIYPHDGRAPADPTAIPLWESIFARVVGGYALPEVANQILGAASQVRGLKRARAHTGNPGKLLGGEATDDSQRERQSSRESFERRIEWLLEETPHRAVPRPRASIVPANTLAVASGKKKELDPETAKAILAEAGSNKNRARTIARQRGYRL